MMQVIRSADRYHRDAGWLSARWHFSFDTYHDPSNIRWGALRVFNDDVIQPGQGFPFHPHRDMEIITIVLKGALQHKDNQGGSGVIRPGDIQVMTAGTGIVHSEFNPSDKEPVHLMQIWILPERRGLTPRYDQRSFDAATWQNRLQPVVSNHAGNGTLQIHQDATIYRADLEAGHEVTHTVSPERRPYLFVVSGAVKVNGEELFAGDQGRIADEPEVRIEAIEAAEILLLDLPEIA